MTELWVVVCLWKGDATFEVLGPLPDQKAARRLHKALAGDVRLQYSGFAKVSAPVIIEAAANDNAPVSGELFNGQPKG